MEKLFIQLKKFSPIILLMLAMHMDARANESVDTIFIATEAWDQYTNEDGSGLFLDIVRAVYEPHDIQIKVDYVPYNRALHLLKFKAADAMFGTYSAEKEAKDYILTPHYPIDTERTVAIFKKSPNQKWQGIESLRNQKLGWVRGYDYHDNLGVKIASYAEVLDSSQGLKMLEAGRFDYFLDHAGELDDNIAKTGFDMSDFQIASVFEENIYMAFARTEKGKQLSILFDQAISGLIRSGRLQQLYDQYGMHFPLQKSNDR